MNDIRHTASASRMRVHLAKITPNRFGGTNTTSMCGRLNKASNDGMNITDVHEDVTCKFCLGWLRRGSI